MRRGDLADTLRQWAVASGTPEHKVRSIANNAMIRRYVVRLGPMELFDDDEAVSLLVRQANTAEEFTQLITNYDASNTTENDVNGQATRINA